MGEGQGGLGPPHPRGVDDQCLRLREGSSEFFSSASFFLRSVADRSLREGDRRDSVARACADSDGRLSVAVCLDGLDDRCDLFAC